MNRFSLDKIKLAFRSVKIIFVLLAIITTLFNLRFVVGVFMIDFMEEKYSDVFAIGGLLYLLVWILVYGYLIYKKKAQYWCIVFNFLLNFIIILVMNDGRLATSATDFLSVLNILDG